ncbi:MAG: TadE family type IV pilus minor pilin [Acidimicrobiia bacterium]|nr:TadE family type IV pilus minor pilin [Acidimicrobiia bacterium]MDX2465781.1 TadE family type IV pilus minor pilin [Acidimicrobiia bacterium]
MNRGSSTVEFALLIPLVVLLLALIVEVSLAARLQIEVVGAAREGARVAATTPDPAAALTAATTALGERGGEARIAVHRPHVIGATAEVRVSLPYQVRLPLFDHITIPLSASAAMRVER